MKPRDLSSITRLTSGTIVGVTCLLALLYFGRDILAPLALASILSLIMAPLVRSLGRLGLGRVSATLSSVFLAGVCVAGMAFILASQLAAITGDLPQYRAAIRAKLNTVREVTERPFARIEAELSAVAPQISASEARKARRDISAGNSAGQPVPVEVRPPRLTTQDALGRLVSLVWGPIGEAGVVLVLLVFILLEHESLRDRLVRLAGRAEISRTIGTLADAAHGVSRFFFSQFIVNATFGTAIGLLLWLAGVPHAALWGTLTAVLRFVPYLGVLAAGSAIALFAAATDPGWGLAISCLVVFVALEVVLANFIEPKVYGHSSGLSPLAVIVSALFWGSFWGPVGLLLSTPLTLCLVVAGRHIRTLEPVTILLGEAPDVSAAERFYQRALTGESDAIIRDARTYLKRGSFARYCDQVLFPGLGLATADFRGGRIDNFQQDHIRATISDVAEALAPSQGKLAAGWRRRHVSLLNSNVGSYLRQLRMARSGRWQGPLDVPARSVVLCAGLATERDDVLGELLVRALREAGVDARSLSLGAAQESPGPEKAELVSTVFITYPLEASVDQWLAAVRRLRAGLPKALLVTIRLPMDDLALNQSLVHAHVDMILRSFEEALAFVAPQRPRLP